MSVTIATKESNNSHYSFFPPCSLVGVLAGEGAVGWALTNVAQIIEYFAIIISRVFMRTR